MDRLEPTCAGSNSFAGASSTTLYDIDSTNDTLQIQNPPNNGTLILVGALGFDTSDTVGFDIATIGSTNFAYATLSVGNVGGNLAAISIAIVSDHIFQNGFD